MGHCISADLRTPRQRSPQQRQSTRAEAEERERRGFGNEARSSTWCQRGIVPDSERIVVLEVRRCEIDGAERADELNQTIAFRAVNYRACRRERGAAKLGRRASAKNGEWLIALG